MLNDEDILNGCRAGDALAQKELYDKYSPKLWPICLRYAKNVMSAEDIMQEGFIRIFRYINDYKGEGSFEGWLRRVMVNTAINYYKKNLQQKMEKDIDEVYDISIREADAISQMTTEEILSVVQTLPDGYRTIFNLFVIEGFSHKVIAETLGITENTSKSQLSRARVLLQHKINKIYRTGND
ncbi:MAG: sigma-70 family RNA polymerase sigma factor [Bacteroidales bacterium]|nr:sigma-70 family RNA polymerase sigma factor [Bacteroidales bacterium]